MRRWRQRRCGATAICGSVGTAGDSDVIVHLQRGWQGKMNTSPPPRVNKTGRVAFCAQEDTRCREESGCCAGENAQLQSRVRCAPYVPSSNAPQESQRVMGCKSRP